MPPEFEQVMAPVRGDLVIRRQGITFGIDKPVQIIDPQSTAANIVFEYP
jgi:hypothetical protein